MFAFPPSVCHLGNDSNTSLDLPPEDHLSYRSPQLVGKLDEGLLLQDVGQLLSPGQIRRSKWGVPDHSYIVLEAESPANTS